MNEDQKTLLLCYISMGLFATAAVLYTIKGIFGI
jgi:hypothetical protein